MHWAKLSLNALLQSVARWVTEAERVQRLLLGETGEEGTLCSIRNRDLQKAMNVLAQRWPSS